MVAILQEIFSRRNLLYELVMRDLKIRYARKSMGFLWTFLMPFATVITFYVIFCQILKVKIGEAPFFLYLMSGVFSWRFFHDSVAAATTCLTDNKKLVQEPAFPHYFIPLAITLANVINFLPSLFITVVISLFVSRGNVIFIFSLPFIICIHVCLTAGVAVIFSILYVRWRNVKYVVELFLFEALYTTPVFYSIYLIKATFPDIFFKIFLCNPFTGILNLYRIALLRGFYDMTKNDLSIFSLIIGPLVFTIGILILGYMLYERHKTIINDYLSG